MDATPPEPACSTAARRAAAAWFGPVPLEVGPPCSGGFAGSAPVCLRPCGALRWSVLKAFAAGRSRASVEWVHGLVRYVAAAGVAEVPVPLATASGATIVTDADGTHWELVPFVEGTATAAPTAAQAAAALAALARIHVAAASLPGAGVAVGPAACVARRVAGARAIADRPWRERRAVVAVDDALTAAVAARWDAAIEWFDAARGRAAIAAAAATPIPVVPLQAVWRDVWWAHVLFARESSDRVAAVIDAHAAAIDSPVTDVARLVSSWSVGAEPAAAADPAAAWSAAIAAYEAIRPLDRRERPLVPYLHAAGVVCGLDNWFRWTLEDRRSFSLPAAVLARIDRLLADLPAALEWLADGGADRV